MNKGTAVWVKSSKPPYKYTLSGVVKGTGLLTTPLVGHLECQQPRPPDTPHATVFAGNQELSEWLFRFVQFEYAGTGGKRQKPFNKRI